MGYSEESGFRGQQALRRSVTSNATCGTRRTRSGTEGKTIRRYHHIGVPTTESKPGKTHYKHLKFLPSVTRKANSAWNGCASKRVRPGDRRKSLFYSSPHLNYPELSEITIRGAWNGTPELLRSMEL